MNTKVSLQPFPINENKRLAALEHYDILDSEAEKQFDRLTLLASEICETPISLVSLIDGKRQWFKSRVGLAALETPREISFCQHAILSQEIFEVEDARVDARFADNPLVTGDPNIGFYAGYPLTDKNGFNLGTLCVIDRVSRKLNKYQKKALKILAEEVMDVIQSRKQIINLARYEKFFNLSLKPHVICSIEGHILDVNFAFSDALGYSEQELMMLSFKELVHDKEWESTFLEFHNMSKGYKAVNFKNRLRNKSGEYIQFSWCYHPDPFTKEIFGTGDLIVNSNL